MPHPSRSTSTASPEEAKVRDLLEGQASAAASKAALRSVLSLPCPLHAVGQQEPCWLVPADWQDYAAVCGDRIRCAGYLGVPTPRATTTKFSKAPKARWS